MIQFNLMIQNSATVSDTFSTFIDNFINQLPGIGLGLLIIVLGILIA